MLLGVDLGTGSVKAAVADDGGAIVAQASVGYAVSSPRAGWAETAPDEWEQAAAAAVREVVGRSGRPAIDAVGLSGQMHGVVLCDGDTTPLRPAVLWADTRTVDELDAYRALPASAHERLANPLAVGMAGPSLLWLREHEPDCYRAARWALQAKDWLRLRLTGEAATDPSDASATLLYDLPGDGWAFDVVAQLGLRADLLPPLRPSAATAGLLSSEAARRFGLRDGTPVATGAADTAAAAIGTGLIAAGEVQLTVGTGGQVVAPIGSLRVDPSRRTHVYRSALPSGWYAMAAMQNAGLALEWVRSLLGVDWGQLYAEAFSVPAGAQGARFLPYLSGERSPFYDPSARGCWAGLGLHHRRAHLLRAALEGVAFGVRDCVEALVDAGVAVPALRLAGGGSVDPRWRRLLADVLGRPLFAVEDVAASARGAALLAGVTAGRYPGVAEAATPVHAPLLAAEPTAAAARYAELYAEQRALSALLRARPEPAQP